MRLEHVLFEGAVRVVAVAARAAVGGAYELLHWMRRGSMMLLLLLLVEVVSELRRLGRALGGGVQRLSF